MKKFIFIILSVLFVISASAQSPVALKEPPPLSPTQNISQYLGKLCAIADTVCGYKVVNNGMFLLDIGANYPNQVLTVVVKGNRILLKPSDLVGKVLYVRGMVMSYRNKPEIIVSDPDMIHIYSDDEH